MCWMVQLDRSDWKAPTEGDAIAAVRLALKAANSPYADVSLAAELLEYVDDGVWLVVPDTAAPQDADVAAMVHVVSGVVEIGGYHARPPRKT